MYAEKLAPRPCGYLHFCRYATSLGVRWARGLGLSLSRRSPAAADPDRDEHTGTTPAAVPFSGVDGLGLSSDPSSDRRDRDLELEADADADRDFYTGLGALTVGAIAGILRDGPRRSWQSCSWCHELNEIVAGAATFCAKCGHRADLPRILCDCGAIGCLMWWPR